MTVCFENDKVSDYHAFALSVYHLSVIVVHKPWYQCTLL